MRKFLIWIATIFFPGIIFLIMGKPIRMIVAFALQVSLLGWIPAMIWARAAWREDLKTKQSEISATETAPPSEPQAPPKTTSTNAPAIPEVKK